MSPAFVILLFFSYERIIGYIVGSATFASFIRNAKGFRVEYSRARISFTPMKNPLCVECPHLYSLSSRLFLFIFMPVKLRFMLVLSIMILLEPLFLFGYKKFKIYKFYDYIML